MVEILELSRREKQAPQSLLQRTDMFSALVRAKVLTSFRIIERDMIPLLNEIDASLEHAIGDATSDAMSRELPAGTLESVKAMERLMCKINSLLECYRTILVPESRDGEA